MAVHYDTLNIRYDATPDEIQAAFDRFREKIGAYAPGIQITDDLIRDNYPFVWEAYAVLSEPSSRASYDSTLAINSEHAEEVIEVQSVPQKPLDRFFSVIAAIGLMGAILLFLSFLGGYLF